MTYYKELGKKLRERHQAIDSKVEKIEKYQKYVNTELDYCVMYGDSSEKIDIADNTPITQYLNIFEGNMEIDDNGYIKLSKGKIYKVIAKGFTLANGTAIIIFDSNGKSYSPLGYVTGTNDYTDLSSEVIIEADDSDIFISYKTDYKLTTQLNFCSIMVQEINRQITIDPLEHVNTESGIEDIPIGSLIAHTSTTPPKHYLTCDGAEYNILDYPYLAEHIKTEFGEYNHFGGDGIATFCVPNFKESKLYQWECDDAYCIEQSGEFCSISDRTYTKVNDLRAIKAIVIGTLGVYVYLISTDKDAVKSYSSYKPSEIEEANTSFEYKSLTWYISVNRYGGFNSSVGTAGDIQVLRKETTHSFAYEEMGKFILDNANVNRVYAKYIKYEPTYFMVRQNTNYMMPTMYSENERVVGCWINGKPLYEKTIKITNGFTIPANEWYKLYDASALNIDCYVKGHFGRTSLNSTDSMSSIDSQYNTADKFLYLARLSELTCVDGIRATIQYTKTTDAENSFTTDMIKDYIASNGNSVSYTDEEISTMTSEILGGES